MGFPQPGTGSVTEDTGVVGGFLTATGDMDFGPFVNNENGGWTPETISGLYGSALTIDADGVWTYQADNSNATIQALNTGDTLTEVFTVSSTNGTTTITITLNGLDEPPCFVEGTLIDTPQGPRPVETLKAGDEVITRDNGVQRLIWAGQRALGQDGPLDDNLQPIRPRKNCFGPGVPDRDVLVSPMHRILVRNPTVALVTGDTELFCPARSLVNGQTILRENVSQTRYVHLLCDRHEVLLSSGCESESLYAGPVGLGGFEDAARQEVLDLFPDLAGLEGSYGQTARRVAKRFEAQIISDALRPRERLLAALRDVAA